MANESLIQFIFGTTLDRCKLSRNFHVGIVNTLQLKLTQKVFLPNDRTINYGRFWNYSTSLSFKLEFKFSQITTRPGLTPKTFCFKLCWNFLYRLQVRQIQPQKILLRHKKFYNIMASERPRFQPRIRRKHFTCGGAWPPDRGHDHRGAVRWVRQDEWRRPACDFSPQRFEKGVRLQDYGRPKVMRHTKSSVTR